MPIRVLFCPANLIAKKKKGFVSPAAGEEAAWRWCTSGTGTYVVLFRFPLGCLSDSAAWPGYPESNWKEDSNERADESALLLWKLSLAASWVMRWLDAAFGDESGDEAWVDMFWSRGGL